MIRLGPFVVSARLGVGGMGEVFRARRVDAAPGEPDIALKLIRGEYADDPYLRDLFLREARIGALLHHPSIVELHQVGEVDGTPYLAIEYVDGVSLDRLLGRPLSTAAAVQVGLSLAAALDYIHRLEEGGRPLRLVHRDVSPANVLIGRHGAVKLGDFGIAKLPGASLTLTNEVKGKRGYMAPEQLQGGAVDGRADLFSLGALLHRIANGEPLFRDIADFLAAGAPRPPGGGPLAAVVARATEPEPSARFQSAAELHAALCAVCQPGPEAEAELAERAAERMSERPALSELDRVILAELGSEVGDTARVEPPMVGAPPPPRRRFRPGWIAAGAAGAIAVTVTVFAVSRPADQRPATVAAVAPPDEAPSPLAARDAGGDAGSPAPRPRRRREEPGFLTLDTRPWATVYLAGRKIGTTPFHRIKLPAGRHRLSLDVEDSGRRRSLTVAIRPGAELRRSVDLR